MRTLDATLVLWDRAASKRLALSSVSEGGGVIMKPDSHTALAQELLERIRRAKAFQELQKRDVFTWAFDKRLRAALAGAKGGRVLARRADFADALEKTLWIGIDAYEELVAASLIRYEAYRAFFGGEDGNDAPLNLLGMLDDREKKKAFDPNPTLVDQVLQELLKELGMTGNARTVLHILDTRSRIAVILTDLDDETPDAILDAIDRVKELMADGVEDEAFGFPLEQTLDLLAACLALVEESDASIH